MPPVDKKHPQRSNFIFYPIRTRQRIINGSADNNVVPFPPINEHVDGTATPEGIAPPLSPPSPQQDNLPNQRNRLSYRLKTGKRLEPVSRAVFNQIPAAPSRAAGIIYVDNGFYFNLQFAICDIVW